MGFLEVGLRALVVTVFLTAVVGKLSGRRALAEFARSLYDTGLAPWGSRLALALLVVSAEGTVCVLLAWPARWAAISGAFVAAALLTVFATGIALVVRREVDASCRCFGTTAARLGTWHIVRNALLATAAAGIVPTAGTARSLPAGQAFVVALTGIVLGGVAVKSDSVVDLFRSVPSTAPAPRRSRA